MAQQRSDRILAGVVVCLTWCELIGTGAEMQHLLSHHVDGRESLLLLPRQRSQMDLEITTVALAQLR